MAKEGAVTNKEPLLIAQKKIVTRNLNSLIFSQLRASSPARREEMLKTMNEACVYNSPDFSSRNELSSDYYDRERDWFATVSGNCFDQSGR